VPDDLATHEKADFRHILDDVGMKRNIGFAAQIGNVDAGPAPRHQDAVDLLPDPLEKFEILFQGKVFVIVFAHVIGGEVTIKWTL